MKRAFVSKYFLQVLFLAASILSFTASGHVGSPTVFFDGHAGPYPVHVIIQPAEVVPGLAEISVRTDGGGVERVTALPMMWNTGRKGAPPPDVAALVPGETNLYHAQLWFMEEGAQSVELELTGSSGLGRVTIPVDAVATRVLSMPKQLGTILAVLGVLLVAMLVSIVGAAVRESVVQPGHAPTSQRRSAAIIAMVGGTLVMALVLRGGQRWWGEEASDYTNHRLYRPVEAHASVQVENGRRVLRLQLPKLSTRAPLVPDHGKLMHLFMMRKPGLDAFAHLHPLKLDRLAYESLLPDLPAGNYRLYGDITHETGFTETLTATVSVPEKAATIASGPRAPSKDVDDSWVETAALQTEPRSLRSRLSSQYEMIWLAPEKIAINQPLSLRFTIRDAQGKPAKLEPYLGMRGHLALTRDDGSVFTHLHPGGTASMAAMQLSTLRADGKLPLQAAFGEAEPICRLPADAAGEQPWLSGSEEGEGVSFPYAFPKPGQYRMWVQVKIAGEILTGVFDPEVQQVTSKTLAGAKPTVGALLQGGWRGD